MGRFVHEGIIASRDRGWIVASRRWTGDLITERDNEWATVYEPSRKTLRSLREFVRENLNVAREYTDLVTPGDVDSMEEIKPGAGATIRRSLTKVAIY